MMFFQKHLIVFLLSFLVPLFVVKCSKLQEEQISRWAETIGNDLWALGGLTTNFRVIKQHYVFFNAQVETKDLEKLILEVGTDIERMMDRKSDAIKCISERAEQAAESSEYNSSEYKYHSSKYSDTSNETKIKLPGALKDNKDMYLGFGVNSDTHFYNLAVNTTYSSVHVPTNIYDKHKEAAFAIQWSKELDEVFVQNYKSDPALSWQYFGSASGILRHYPGKRWHEVEKDEFDCRVRTWYIEAATCTKDVVIVVDNSGSMDGMGRHIATLTVNTILDTFSNNDYINILFYSNETTNYTIPCFKDLLVQATPENIMAFKEALRDFRPSGKTDLPQSLQMAFDILERYREKRGCNSPDEGEDGKSKACNQVIMVITDGLGKNMSDIIFRNNHLEGGRSPVRIFTYLIGKEVINVPEFRWMACANRGFYAQVQTLEQVTSSVLQYINVIARPLVLQAEDHPISWTHAYIDMTYDDKQDDQINVPYRLLTSAAVPAFDKKSNRNNETRVANLLGVAGTDVPIDDIEKLTLPYKLGVNAYAFIISNNGYVLMHRDFRPMFKGHLRKNYNSIDLIEIEQFAEDLDARVISPELEDLRNKIVNGSQGSVHNVSIKYHYDDMRRVIVTNYSFYYVPLNQTPFSLAFAIPDGYGNYSLHVEDEIKNDRHKPGVKITDYFDSNWKIHPKWVYCKYHYLEGHEYDTPEEEIIDFLKKVNEDNFIWEKQYEGSDTEELTKVDCGRKTHEDDDYYCDEHLVQRLVFDGKNTHKIFNSPPFSTKEEQDKFNKYNTTLRFVATMSGLTRWDYLSEEVENNTEKEFGDLHSKAIDETWYKSAVIQYRYDKESFVYSVPFDWNPDEDLLITGSYAVFPTDAEVEAPGCVVGYQFAHKNFVEIVTGVTNHISNECVDCSTCEQLKCYIIDTDGYIIVSFDGHDTGNFFGEIESDIVESMINRGIFKKVTIYDYQAICNIKDDESSDASVLYTPVHYIKFFINWCIMKISWLALEINLRNLWSPLYTFAKEIANTDTESKNDYDDEKNFYDCEKFRYLYMPGENLTSHNFPGEISDPNSRPFYLKKIPHSNLLFVAINDTMPPSKYQHSTNPTKVIYKDTISYCQKVDLNNLPRRRLAGCYNEHPLESEIKICGQSSTIRVSFIAATVCLLSRYL